ncbi:MAG: hypothetical protein J6W11_02355 [Alphaproteobacteria bacterium]|nr:hypothetical protein [Alphaproteobacteria bacterium]
MQVISMTRGKIRQDYINGQEIIVKQSSFDEVRKIEQARNIFKNRTIILDGKDFIFHLPRIYDYKDNQIYMEFLSGNNLEIDLRTSKNRENAVKITNILFQYMYDNQIYWGDFAPRNIMIDTDRQSINLCDFERGIQSNITSKEFLQNYAYEEYAAFLFPHERIFSEKLNNIFHIDKPLPITMNDIHSNRVKSIIQEKHLPTNQLTTQTIANINKLIILAETPYKINSTPVFPIIDLEQTKDISYQLFAQKVCSIIARQDIIHGHYTRV